MARPKMKTDCKKITLSVEGDVHARWDMLAKSERLSRTAYLEKLIREAPNSVRAEHVHQDTKDRISKYIAARIPRKPSTD